MVKSLISHVASSLLLNLKVLLVLCFITYWHMFIYTDTEMLKQSEIYERYAVFFYHRHSFLRLKRSAQLIQQAVRSWLCWRPQQGCSITPKLTSSDMVTAATTVQKFIRGWLVKRDFLFQRDAVVKIQSVSRSLKYQKTLICQKDAALEIQRLIRGHLTRNRLLGCYLIVHVLQS